MIYCKYTEKDLEQLAEASLLDYNKWIDENRYATCTACGKEYLYSDSPILVPKSWKKVVEYYGLSKFEKKSKELFSTLYPYAQCVSPKDKEKVKRFRIKNIIKITPNILHCTVCIDCMNAASGGVKAEDVDGSCKMGKDYIKKHFNL